jgi:hypothetical protein
MEMTDLNIDLSNKRESDKSWESNYKILKILRIIIEKLKLVKINSDTFSLTFNMNFCEIKFDRIFEFFGGFFDI